MLELHGNTSLGKPELVFTGLGKPELVACTYVRGGPSEGWGTDLGISEETSFLVPGLIRAGSDRREKESTELPTLDVIHTTDSHLGWVGASIKCGVTKQKGKHTLTHLQATFLRHRRWGYNVCIDTMK